MKYHGVNAPLIPEDDKARFYLNLSEANGDQVELVAKEQDELRNNGIPPMMTRELDNKYTTTTPNPEAGITRVITENPYTAAYFQGDQMNLWNKVAKEMRSLLPYDPNADYALDKYYGERRQKQAEERKRILTEGDEIAQQNAVMRDMMARFGDWRNRDDSTLRYWLNTSGKATGIDTSGWDVEDFRKRGGLGNVEWEKAVDLFGWQEIQDAYRMMFHPEYRPQNLVNLDENAPAYLLLARKQMLEDENKMLRGNEWTVNVLNSVLQSVPFMTEMAITGGESAAVRSFMEMGYKEAYRQGGVKLVSKMLAKGLGGAMTNGLKRLPFYAPKAAAEAYTDNYLGGFATMPDGEGGVSIEVNDLDSRNFFEGFVSHMLQSYAEVASEELGGLVPFGNVDATVLGRLVPKRLRNAFVSRIAWNPMTRRAFGKHILGNLPFHGFIGEFTEEELGNVMSFMATELMQLLGAKEQNTPQTEGLLMGAGETGETAASIMLQTLLFRGLAGTVNTWRPGGAAYALKSVSRVNRESKQFDAAATTVGQSRIGQASVPEARRVLDGIRGGDDTLGITPESAENILLQATEGKSDEEADGARETLAQAGITPESIAQARKDGTDLMLSSNTLLALAGNKKFKNAWDLVHRIRENMVSEVFGKTTKEITADGFTKEQIDEMVDRSKRQEDFLLDVQKTMSEAIRTAQKNAIAAGNKLGISQQNVQDFVNIYKWMANYLAENVETEEGLAKLKEMVNNLSVQFAEAPEKFDTTSARDALGQVSPVWTGSAASYDQTSLQYVGTGEGNQVYGWGLYGSAKRRVAEWYAKKDFQRKSRPGTLKFRGKEVIGPIGVVQAFEDVSDYRERVFREAALRRFQRYVEDAYGASLSEIVGMVKEEVAPLYDGLTRERWDSIIDDVAKDLELVSGPAVSRNLYKQTFWPDKEENLLDWEEFVSANQAEKVARGLFESLEQRDIPYSVFRLAGMPGHSPMNPLYDLTVSSDPVAEDGSQRLFLTRGKSDGHSVTISEDGTLLRNAWNDELTGRPLSDLVGESAAKYIMEHRNGGTYQTFVYHPTQQDAVEVLTPEIASMTGGELYEQLEDILGSPKDASEFLYRAGIDGVTYIGDSSGARNYVAFSDKDIRVDERILFQDGMSEVAYLFSIDPDPDIRQAYAQEAGLDEEELRDTLREQLPGTKLVNREDQNNNAEINANQAKKLVSDSAIAKSKKDGFTALQHLTAVANIEKLYENANLIWEGKGEKGDDPHVIIRRFVAPVVFGDRVAGALITQKVSDGINNGAKRVYSLELEALFNAEEKETGGQVRLSLQSLPGIERFAHEGFRPGGWNNVERKYEKVKRFLEKTLDQGEKIVKGQINLARFAESQQAIISLFKDADASTLPHESAHWLKAAMESLVGAGFATDKMKQDLDTINAWLDKQDYSGAVTDQDKYRAREEYFARAFEQYLREGRFPEAATNGLKSALRRLARMLQSIYRNALALNAPIDDSIRSFFDDIFAVEEVVDGTSVLSGILREINTGALAFSKEDLKKLETAVAGAREDAETEAWLAALQDYQKGLKEQQKLWRNEAKEAYEASKAEQAYTYVRNGHKLDENFLRNVLKLDEETISILKKKRLTYKAAPVEAPVEAPVVAETAAPAVESAPAETPASTASAEAQAATPLDGTSEQFDALGEDTIISLPEGEEAAQNAVANLVYGPDGKGGALWKRIKVRPTGAELGDVLYKLYTVALDRLSEPAPVTKAELIGYLSRTAFNTEQQAFRDQQKAPESMDETVFEGKDGDGASRYDVTRREDFGFTSGDSEAYLTALSDFTETLADGTLKREIADIIYELSDAGEQATNEAIMAEYRQRGGTRQKTSLYDAIKEVRRSIRDYMQNNGFLQSLDVETPASILDTMKELDYGDVNDLITDLKTALGRSAFIKDYMNRKHAEYRNAFLDNPNWASEAGATRYLDAILRALKVTEGMKFSERARIAASEATRELMASANVRDVMNGERGVATSLRSNAAKVLRALKSGKEDKAAAITAALDMYRNDARLRAIRKLRADIQKTLNRAKRIGKSKPGSTLDGDTINAVKALLNRFGMSSAEPQWTTGPGDPQSVLAVMKEFTPDLEAELTHWSPWMRRVLTGEEAKTSWQNLTPEQFYELTDLIDYLRGEGRQSLMDQKGTFASNLRTAMEAILPSVEEHKTGDYTDPADKTMLQKLGSLARSSIHQMKTLVFMAHLLDGRTEFYGDHTIGPVRKFFQLPLSEGASRELFWYQKTSKEIMPHLQALMRSAKERNLLFAVNNPDNRSYTELRGETAAFVLLNAGAVENRQRLMESFGWSEDELNGLLAQFTKEDFENAEAIWKSLNEMGQELAKVYYRERHYRMPWATPSPISLTLNDGTEILSEGGYYPIAYTYHDSTQGYDPDIMNPFTKPNKPSRPTATFGRTPVLSDLSLLMSPAVVDRSIRENAHYIGMWEPLRMANSIWTNKDFKQAVIRNFSKETYDALKQLMDNVNNPDKGDKGLWKQVANKLGACLATTALGFKITTMAKQYASVTIGAERLGDYFHDAVSFALRDLKGLRRAVNEESPFMRDRYNLMDRDLRVVNTEFKKPIAKAADKYRYAAFWGLKQNDLNVAAVQWYAAFNWALDPKRGMTKDQARAYADDFVASTQGAARTIDTPVVQLETLGRLMTPFFGPACAAANTRLAGLSVFKQMDAGERIAFAVDNFLVPGLVMTLVAAVRGGLLNPDDDDDWDRIRKQSLIALLTEPVSGLPVVQDIADSVVRAAVTGRPVQSGVFEVSLFRPAEDVSREFVNMFRYWNELGYTTYAAASITGMLFGMPVVQVYEDYEKMILWNFGDKSSKPIKKQLQGEKRK